MQGRVAPAWPDMRGALPLCTPLERALRPAPRVPFVSRRKEPKACQNLRFWTPSRFQQNFGNLTQSGSRDGTLALSDWKPQPSLSALFALAYASRRAGFCHCRSWICHFEMMSQLVLSSPWVLAGRYFLLSIRGTRGLVARLDATLGAIRGIGEGVFLEANRKRSGGNGGDGRRLNPIMSRTRNNLFIKFTASLEFVSGWFPVRFRLRFHNKWLNYAIYQPPGNEKLLFLLKKDL